MDQFNTDEMVRFLRDYYKQDVYELAQRYPKEQTTLRVDYGDVFAWKPSEAEAWLTSPQETQARFEAALRDFDLPADVSLTEARVVLTGLDDGDTYYPNELTTDNAGYVAVSGKLGRVTAKDEIPLEAAFECQRCGTMTYIPQTPGEMNEPHECQGCERQGPFRIDDQQTDWDDYCKIRVETPPDETGSANSEYIDGYCVGETVHAGGEHGLIGRAGDDVIAYGTVERQRKEGADDALYERVLRVKAIEFPADNQVVNVDEHIDEIRELAAREDAVDLFAESIAPELYQTEAWSAGMRWAVAYLFAAPRIDIPDGPTYRGDVHGAIFSDFGMGKSMFSAGVEAFSPNAIRKSATGLSSDVGLTAAAVKDDFGSGQWTLKPGILVRANGGHVILDEIDKGPDDLSSINDSIEQEQTVDVDKAGLSATYESRCGVLVLGNPVEGRFNKMDAVAPQIGVDSSTLSRFDGIITMEDQADEEIDAEIAERSLEAYAEAQQMQYHDRDELDVIERAVSVPVGRAWVKYARENVFPEFTKDRIPEIRDWYAKQVRGLNKSFAESGGEGEDMPVPATARVVMWAARFSVAFARVRLSDTVEDHHVEQGKELAKQLVSQHWDGEKFDAGKSQSNSTNRSQRARRKRIVKALDGTALTVSQVADQVRTDYETVRNDLKQLTQNGDIDKLPNGRYEA